MNLRWDYPAYTATAEPRSDATKAKEARKALPREQAMRIIAGTDSRPLLVLRECARCNKTDDALLQPGADNEKVLFLARWFHCVRIPMDVLEPDHPFHELFPGKSSEHLFVTTADGALKVSLESDTSRTQLCEALTTALVHCYEKDPNPLYKELHVYGDQLDAFDMEVRDLETKRTKLMEDRMPDKKKLAKVDAEIVAVKKKVEAKLAEIEKASIIKLKPGKAPAAKVG